MAEGVNPPGRAADDAPRARRLSAEARKSSILAAARRAFSETGDVTGTSIKVIAEHGGISEGVIYRHFQSKDQLFVEAVVEPLKEAVDELVAASETIDHDDPLTPERQLQALNGLYRQLVSTLAGILPLLGLVLFGDPQVAHKFYREDFGVAMDRLAKAWGDVEDRYGYEVGSSHVSARAVMGIALMLALESDHNRDFDLDRALPIASSGTFTGFFPPITPDQPTLPA